MIEQIHSVLYAIVWTFFAALAILGTIFVASRVVVYLLLLPLLQLGLWGLKIWLHLTARRRGEKVIRILHLDLQDMWNADVAKRKEIIERRFNEEVDLLRWRRSREIREFFRTFADPSDSDPETWIDNTVSWAEDPQQRTHFTTGKKREVWMAENGVVILVKPKWNFQADEKELRWVQATIGAVRKQ